MAAMKGRMVNIDRNRRRLWLSCSLACAGALLAVAPAVSGVARAPSAVTLSVTPGGASCTFSETATPKVKCINLLGERIKSGTTVTLVARANAVMPPGWKLYIQKEPLGSRREHPPNRASYPAPHLCGPTKSATCTVKTTRKVSVTSFTFFRAVVQKADGTSFEADIDIRWCDTTTPGCV